MTIDKNKLEELKDLIAKLDGILVWHPSHSRKLFFVASVVAEMAEIVGYKRGWIDPVSAVNALGSNESD